jgi:hypothetical protein
MTARELAAAGIAGTREKSDGRRGGSHVSAQVEEKGVRTYFVHPDSAKG